MGTLAIGALTGMSAADATCAKPTLNRTANRLLILQCIAPSTLLPNVDVASFVNMREKAGMSLMCLNKMLFYSKDPAGIAFWRQPKALDIKPFERLGRPGAAQAAPAAAGEPPK